MNLGVSYKFSALSKLLKPLKVSLNHDLEIERLSIDSRKVFVGSTALFIALKGDNWDAHDFWQEAYDKGVRAFLVEDRGIVFPPDANVIYVENTLDALQFWAAKHRAKFDLKCLAITGSNGKTLIKEWLYELLSPFYNVVRSPKSYNSQIGVPLSVLQISHNHEFAIIEAGISRENEMHRLAKIINPNIGIFTNLGSAHDEGFSSRENKKLEKAELFNNVDLLIHTSDLGNDLCKSEKIVWNSDEISQENILGQGTTICIEVNNKIEKYVLPFDLSKYVLNCIHCIHLMRYLSISQEDIQKGISKLTHLSMRLEQKQGLNNCTIINDAYNSDFQSLENALEFLNRQIQHEERVLIISDMLETGLTWPQIHNKIIRHIKKANVQEVIGIGEDFWNNQKVFESSNFRFHAYKSTDHFLKEFNSFMFSNKGILLKGARKFRFENIFNRLALKEHATYLEVNLDALIHNLRVYRRRLNPKTKIMAMVKASSYGSGKNEIVNLLEYHKVDYLGVAYADEGTQLRKSGVRLPIMVMNPDVNQIDSIIKYQLEPEIYSFRLLNAFLSYFEKNNISKYPIHLKLDTGMHRLGFEEHDLNGLKEVLINKEVKNLIEVKSIFSHLKSSDDTENENVTKRQIELFSKLFDNLVNVLDKTPIKHILNTAGVLNFPEAEYDMIRLGIGLYGIDSSGLIQNHLENVMTLKSQVSQIKKVPKGEGLGYGNHFVANEEFSSATVCIGYADGINRALGNGTVSFRVSGYSLHTVGNICMDMLMLKIPSKIKISEGSDVILFETQEDIIRIAKMARTIPYEILTSISDRVPKVFVKD